MEGGSYCVLKYCPSLIFIRIFTEDVNKYFNWSKQNKSFHILYIRVHMWYSVCVIYWNYLFLTSPAKWRLRGFKIVLILNSLITKLKQSNKIYFYTTLSWSFCIFHFRKIPFWHLKFNSLSNLILTKIFNNFLNDH